MNRQIKIGKGKNVNRSYSQTHKKKNHFFFFLEKTGILIRTHEYESSIRILKKIYIYYIIRALLQKSLTFVIVVWSYKD